MRATNPASELPAVGTDTGLEGKYDPTNGIAQLIRKRSAKAIGVTSILLTLIKRVARSTELGVLDHLDERNTGSSRN